MTTAIADFVQRLMALRVDRMEDAIDAASDALSDLDDAASDRAELILDGLRWGCRAADVVGRQGGTIVRVIAPDGVRLTHEWRGPVSDEARWRIIQSVLKAVEGEAGG